MRRSGHEAPVEVGRSKRRPWRWWLDVVLSSWEEERYWKEADATTRNNNGLGETLAVHEALRNDDRSVSVSNTYPNLRRDTSSRKPSGVAGIIGS
jgi:hypothetical protein